MIKPFFTATWVAILVLLMSGFTSPGAVYENTQTVTSSAAEVTTRASLFDEIVEDTESLPATIYDLSQLTESIGLTGPTFALEEGVRREISLTGLDSADLFITYTSTSAGSSREKSFAIETPGFPQDVPYRTVILGVNEGTLAPGGVLVFLRADDSAATIQFTSLAAVESLIPTTR